MLKELVPGTSTKADVTALIGSPTATATFDNNTWLYVSEVTRPRIGRVQGVLSQHVVVLSFNGTGVLQHVDQVDQDDFIPVTVVARTTPSPGTEASFLQQLLATSAGSTQSQRARAGHRAARRRQPTEPPPARRPRHPVPDHFAGPRLRAGGHRLRAVVALYPPTDLLALDHVEQRGRAGTRTVRGFVGVEPGADPDRWREASPIEHVHPALPPILLLQGTRDYLVPHAQATSFAARLAAVGAPHRLEIVEGAVHGFDRVGPDDRARELIADARAFLRRELGAG